VKNGGLGEREKGNKSKVSVTSLPLFSIFYVIYIDVWLPTSSVDEYPLSSSIFLSICFFTLSM
jgi:hypothetical protein